ncbi:MAG: DNA gyrase subunit A [Gammaproteobacteria bacterium]|jgi:DNA gyrase subunit A|uniref:DNA gyrase subunit A n=1 Tax=Marinomonas polaris DSM 16579 TaxID=1122206 RepID=A0A1M5DGE5_9GAMM|nr:MULTISPECIES: DNA gyrase subunit A [Marinomonas]MBU1295874.1 DNA gyrase subunit A [Gammaproteobacteria bacterium]MBU1465550.1 DNA gyrase subunit A [Gammaproteobacteria bacterium]MBU2238513.1 DNA gyrase subunit A [Gammaproteobacteria bacterium]MBU2413451.1 DNA gyrase subunit A [Gammaproteobacteria bacterium]SHF66088.1 DNA gyrase subunit A [Marinomonas polaris DSM 16579]
MGELAKEIIPVSIENELKGSYLDYAMSVIVGRALPDVRDGLKPVHRRVLFAMNELKNDWNKPYKKSARIVGDVIGKYHPHGDSAVYDTIVRMAQPFSMRYTLVDGQGNFGSVDGDSAAAMRYTEIRMAKISHHLLMDLEKETVDFVPNYDGTEFMPEVLPARVPGLLVNGSAGIAVGMATNIPPHNLGEIIDGCLAVIDNADITIDELIDHIPGPDFPTGAFINGRAGIIEAYKTGRGRIYMRARHHFEDMEKGNRQSIVFTEIPYQLNKAKVIEKIAELVKEKKLEGISELRDESDKDGMRIVIELRRGENPDVVVNNIFTQTQLQSVFGINMVALVDGRPQLLNIKQILECFVKHRREVVTRRTIYELRKARERGHILEGLAVSLANIDRVIELIRTSPTSAEAKEKIVSESWEPGNVVAMLERAGADACRPDDLEAGYGFVDGAYHLSPDQAQAILDLRLHRLTGLEHDKLLGEYKSLIELIGELLNILSNPDRLMEVIREELEEVRDTFGDARRTEILTSRQDLTIADLIDEAPMVVTISNTGYAKSQPLVEYQAQRRGGRGKSSASMKDEDHIEHLLVTSSHDTIMLFSNFGKVYWLRVFEIPVASRSAKGRPIVNLLPLREGESISALLPLPVVEAVEADSEADDEVADDAIVEASSYIFMATANGTVKKTAMQHFARPRSTGLIALSLDETDELVGVSVTNGENDIMLVSSSGKTIRFKESDVRAMGRTAAGVRGIRLGEDAKVVSLIVPQDGSAVLMACENGYGKRTLVEDFPVYGRGGQGVIGIQVSERNGPVVGAAQVDETDEIILITDQGTLVRTRVTEVSCQGRNTQGVTLIRLTNDEHLVGIERVVEHDEEDVEIDEAGDAVVVDQAPSDGDESPDILDSDME